MTHQICELMPNSSGTGKTCIERQMAQVEVTLWQVGAEANTACDLVVVPRVCRVRTEYTAVDKDAHLTKPKDSSDSSSCAAVSSVSS